MSIKIIPYNKEALVSFKYDGIEKEYVGENINAIVEYFAGLGTTYIGMVDDRVIGVGGAYPLWSGAGGYWLFVNQEVSRYKKEAFKILIKYMKELTEFYKIKTTSVECLDDSIKAHRLLKHLGFTKNKVIKMFCYSKRD